jgi:hypothetical protein
MTYSKEEYQRNKVGYTRRMNTWIERHRDEHNANMRVVMKRHYENNKDKIGEYKRLRYQWKTEVSRLMSMYAVFE